MEKVLGALENGYLEPMQKHENAKTYYQFCNGVSGRNGNGADLE